MSDEEKWERPCDNCGKIFYERRQRDLPIGVYESRAYFKGYEGGNMMWFEVNGVDIGMHHLCNACLADKKVMQKYKDREATKSIKVLKESLAKDEKEFEEYIDGEKKRMARKKKLIKELQAGRGIVAHRYRHR